MGAAHSVGPTPKAHPGRLVCDQNFHHFLDSIFDRFGVVLGRQVGSFSALLAPKLSQVVSKSRLARLSLSKTLIFTKHYACRYRSTIFHPKMTSKWPKLGPRRLQEALENDFLAVEHRLKIGLVLDVDFGRFWLPNPPPMSGRYGLFQRQKSVWFCNMFLC